MLPLLPLSMPVNRSPPRNVGGILEISVNWPNPGRLIVNIIESQDETAIICFELIQSKKSRPNSKWLRNSGRLSLIVCLLALAGLGVIFLVLVQTVHWDPPRSFEYRPRLAPPRLAPPRLARLPSPPLAWSVGRPRAPRRG
jgi:hypothetical protein